MDLCIEKIEELIEATMIEQESYNSACAEIFFASKVEAYEECIELLKSHG